MTEEDIENYRKQCRMAIELNPGGVKSIIADNTKKLCKNIPSLEWEIFLEEAFKAGLAD